MIDSCVIPVVAALFLGAILPGAALIIMSSILKRRLQRPDPARIRILAQRYRARFGTRAAQVLRDQIQAARLCEDAHSARLLQAVYRHIAAE